MPDTSPWSPSAVRAALEAWEAHGQAGGSPEECMRAALAAALPQAWTEYGTRYVDEDGVTVTSWGESREDALRFTQNHYRTPVQRPVHAGEWEPIPAEET